MTKKIPTSLKGFMAKVQVDREVIMRKLGPANAVCGGWALLSVGVFLLWGAPISGDRSDWFPLVVSLLKVGAFLISTMLCWRNAQASDILSGRTVWQAIAAGMAFHALGDITLIIWRSVWGITSAVSLGDVFYGASYIFLAIGFLQAVLPRPINLNPLQTIGIASAGVVGILLACWINFYAPSPDASSVTTGATSTDIVLHNLNTSSSNTSSAEATDISAQVVATDAAAPSDTPSETPPESSAPAIIQLINERLSRVTGYIGLVYVVGDCALVVMAIALLVAFWGGTYSEAWKLLALAALCLYVADMFLIYTVGQGSYRPGSPWEIFWILSALFFGMGAGIEHGISAQMQQRRPRRQWL
ncbi:MAG: hypothetical protein AAGC93_07915 [Cyanobacteria bacterium P01_F01_bin.53]